MVARCVLIASFRGGCQDAMVVVWMRGCCQDVCWLPGCLAMSSGVDEEVSGSECEGDSGRSVGERMGVCGWERDACDL